MSESLKSQDADFEDIKIKSVKPFGSGFDLQREDGWSFFMPECGIIPKPGDIARFYGKGIGFNVRGLDINGQECFYRTPEEDEIKQNDELYGKSALDMLTRWDAGRSVFTVEMGGLGPGYEQAIQILVMELIRNEGNKPIPEDEKGWRDWGIATIHRLNEICGDFSGAQVQAAKNLAARFIKFGPQETFKSLRDAGQSDRIIQVSKHFPSMD